MKKGFLRGLALGLCLACLLWAAPAADAFFGQETLSDIRAGLAEAYGWDPEKMDPDLAVWNASGVREDLWSGPNRDRVEADYEIRRLSEYRTDYWRDMVKACFTYLGIRDGSAAGAARMAALAVAEARACEEEVQAGVYGLRQECGSDNNVMYNIWYYGHEVRGDGYAWCCVFISWLADQCGLISDGILPRTAGCASLAAFMDAAGYESVPLAACAAGGYTPVPGDIVLYGDENARFGHVGVVVSFTEEGLQTVEGNCTDRVRLLTYAPDTLQSGDVRFSRGAVYHVPYPVTEGEEGVYRFLTSEMGLNDAAACGVMANLARESGFRADLEGDFGYGGYPAGQASSYGLCQWHNTAWAPGANATNGYGRWQNLAAFCEENGLDWHTAEGQLMYLREELTARYPAVWSALAAVPDTADGAAEAAGIWCRLFEVPADAEAEAARRAAEARTVYWPKYAGSGLSAEGGSLATGRESIR